MRRLLTPVMLCAALILGAAQGAVAQEAARWQALVVGQPGGPVGQRPFEDAFHASKAFENGGIPVRHIIRDLPGARLLDALEDLEELEAAPRLILYFAGAIRPEGLVMRDGPVALPTLVRQAEAAGVAELVLMLETCYKPPYRPAPVSLPDAAGDMAVMLLAVPRTEGACRPGARLTDRLQDMAKSERLRGPLLDALPEVEVQGAVPTGIVLGDPVTGPAPLPGGEIVYLPENVILLTPVDDDFSEPSVAPDGDDGFEDPSLFVEVVLPTPPPPPPQDGPVITFAPLPVGQLTALPMAKGLPKPAIIVGLIEGVTDAALDPTPDTDTSTVLGFENLAAARALRDANPELFAAMLDVGAFDPPEDIVARALQVELQAMNCYLKRIDNDWGGGSKASVDAYFKAAKRENSVGREATVALFRHVFGHAAVKCPKQVAQNKPKKPRPPQNQDTRQPVVQTPTQPTTPTRPTTPTTPSGNFDFRNFR